MPIVFANAGSREQAREIASQYERRGWRCVEDGEGITCSKRINEIQTHTVIITISNPSG